MRKSIGIHIGQGVEYLIGEEHFIPNIDILPVKTTSLHNLEHIDHLGQPSSHGWIGGSPVMVSILLKKST